MNIEKVGRQQPGGSRRARRDPSDVAGHRIDRWRVDLRAEFPHLRWPARQADLCFEGGAENDAAVEVDQRNHLVLAVLGEIHVGYIDALGGADVLRAVLADVLRRDRERFAAGQERAAQVAAIAAGGVKRDLGTGDLLLRGVEECESITV